MQLLALGPFRAAPELPPLLEALQAALPGLVQEVDDEAWAGDGADGESASPQGALSLHQPLLLPYLPPHRLLERWGTSPDSLRQAWMGYGALLSVLRDPRRTAPARPVNLEQASAPQLVAWLVDPSLPVSETPAPVVDLDPLLALLTLQLLQLQPAVETDYAVLELGGGGPADAPGPGPSAYRCALEALCTPEQLLAAARERQVLAAELEQEQRLLDQRRLDLDHVLEDRDLLARQLNELNAGFEAFYDQASSDAGKLDWNRKRRAELELTLQLQQRELEALARQVKEQAVLIQRSAAASEQMMQLMAAALSR